MREREGDRYRQKGARACLITGIIATRDVLHASRGILRDEEERN